MAAPLLITQIHRLAKHVTNWSVYHERALLGFVSFIAQNTHLKLNFVSRQDDLRDGELHDWPDAESGVDHCSSKSTSGMWLSLVSKDGLRQ